MKKIIFASLYILWSFNGFCQEWSKPISVKEITQLSGYLPVDIKKIPQEISFSDDNIQYWKPLSFKIIKSKKRMYPFFSVLTDIIVVSVLYCTVDYIGDKKINGKFGKGVSIDIKNEKPTSLPGYNPGRN